MKSVFECSWEHQAGEWKQEKRKILNSMIGPSGGFIDIDRHSTIYMERPIAIAPHLGVAESIYAAKIMEYNLSLKHSMQRSSLINSFAGIINDFRDAVSKMTV